MTPLLELNGKESCYLCGNQEQIELLFGETTPSLEEVFNHRRDVGLEFNASEILYIIKNIALALKNLEKINEEHGRVNLSNICMRRDVLLLDSLAFDKKVSSQAKNE